ncbi:MAG: hypothetical protein ABIH23_20865 [bacterium]
MPRFLLRLVKAIMFWKYDRNTWQYDVLAAIIILLIFFSPRGASRSLIHQPHFSVTASDEAGVEQPEIIPPETTTP